MPNSEFKSSDTECEKWWVPENFDNQTSFKIWRYMDLAKYISFLHTSSIRLTRADKFEDPYEGLFNDCTIDVMRGLTKNFPQSLKKMREFACQLEDDKKQTFINCWHWNDKESAAMWKLYSSNDYCISIVSDGFELVRQLPVYVAFTFVRYIDWDRDCFEAPGMSQAPYFHKRKEFAHENEVRVIYMQPLHEQRGGPKLDRKEEGLLIPIKIRPLVKEVVLAPQTPGWVAEMVTETTRKFDYEVPIRTSSLLDTPR